MSKARGSCAFCTKWPLVCVAAIACLSQPALASDDDDDDDEPEQQEVLFVLEEAFTQEKGEWQIGFALSQSLEEGGEREWEAEIEYGLTERLQIEAEFEFEQESGENEIGDIELGLAYAIVESEASGEPEVTLGAAILIPSGDGEGDASGVGFELLLAASQEVTEGLFAHANFGFSEAATRDFDTFRLNQSEWSAGAALAYGFADEWFVIGEYEFAREAEDIGLGAVRASSHTAALGVTGEIAEEFTIGLGGAFVIDKGEESAQVRFLMQVEF
ncbi:MAG: transporter [Pseudomonadota bacterium]